MKTLKLLFNKNNLYFLLLGLTPITFKFIYNKIYVSGIIFGLLILNEILYKTGIFPLKNIIKDVRLNLILLLIYSFFLPIKIMGLVILLTFFVIKFSEIISKNFTYEKKIFTYRFNIGKIFFFFFIAFIIGILFFYFYSGYITKKETIFLFLTSFVFALLQKLKPTYFSLLFFGVPAIILINFIDFRIRISMINIMFGTIITGAAFLLLIFLDIIKLEKSLKYYLVLFFFYIGLGYMLFLFNYILLLFDGIIFKLRKGADRFIFINDVKSFYLLSLIINISFFILPHYTFIKSSLVVSLITLFIYKNYDFFYERLKIFMLKNKYSFLHKHNINIIILNILISFLLLIIAYKLNLILFKNIYIGLIIINLIWFLYKHIENRYHIEYKILEFIPFQLFLLWSIK